jgi:hypothetical protein
MDDAIAVHVPDAEHGWVDLPPLHHPLRQLGVWRTYQMLQELGLDQRRERWRDTYNSAMQNTAQATELRDSRTDGVV